jgi:hypothetical protein
VPDYVTVVDLGASPPRVVGEVNAPASVVGPPQSVAVSHDESFVLVVASTKVDPADPKKTVPDNRLTVIDLKAKPIAVVQTLEAGAGAAGVSINRAGPRSRPTARPRSSPATATTRFRFSRSTATMSNIPSAT